MGSIPGLPQLVKDLALLWAVGWFADWDLALLWLHCRLTAVALIRSRAWEPPYAVGMAIKKARQKPKNDKKKKLFYISGIQKSKMGQQDCVLGALGKNPFPCHSQLLQAAHISWLAGNVILTSAPTETNVLTLLWVLREACAWAHLDNLPMSRPLTTSAKSIWGHE